MILEVVALALLAVTRLPAVGAGDNLRRHLGTTLTVPVLALSAILIAVWANDRTSDAPAVVTTQGPSAIAIETFAFGPDALTVSAGTAGTWTNADPFPHSVIAGNGEFASEPLTAGASCAFTLTTPGTYPFICGIHPSRAGSVAVTP